MSGIYRFQFDGKVPGKAIEDNLFWASVHAESVFGKAKVRLDSAFLYEKGKHVCVIDKTTDVGILIAQVFTSLIIREFGETSFQVQRLPLHENALQEPA